MSKVPEPPAGTQHGQATSVDTGSTNRRPHLQPTAVVPPPSPGPPAGNPISPPAADNHSTIGQIAGTEGWRRGAGQRSWADLFSTNRLFTKETELQYELQKEGRVELGEQDVDPIHTAMGACLVGRFVGNFPGWRAINAMVDRWKVKCDIQMHCTMWLVFQFHDVVDCDQILQGGPYMANGSPLYLKPLPSGFLFQQDELQRLPVWMQFLNLPLECWTTRALSKLTSKIGRPLYMDQMTRQRKRISFARVLVETDITKAPPTSIPVTLPSGIEVDLNLHFESNFKFCLSCRRMGHYAPNCEAQTGQQPVNPTPQCPITQPTQSKQKPPPPQQQPGALITTGQTKAQPQFPVPDLCDQSNRSPLCSGGGSPVPRQPDNPQQGLLATPMQERTETADCPALVEPTHGLPAEMAISQASSSTQPAEGLGKEQWIVQTKKKGSKSIKTNPMNYVTALPAMVWTEQPYSVAPCQDSGGGQTSASIMGGHKKTGAPLPRGLGKSQRFREMVTATKGKKKITDTERRMPPQDV